jgi:hypothetical protein
VDLTSASPRHSAGSGRVSALGPARLGGPTSDRCYPKNAVSEPGMTLEPWIASLRISSSPGRTAGIGRRRTGSPRLASGAGGHMRPGNLETPRLGRLAKIAALRVTYRLVNR